MKSMMRVENKKGEEEMTSAKVRAKQVRNYFLKGDDYIAQHNHSFDNKWENDDGEEVAKEFRKLYYADELLQQYCRRSSCFGPAMIVEGVNAP